MFNKHLLSMIELSKSILPVMASMSMGEIRNYNKNTGLGKHTIFQQDITVKQTYNGTISGLVKISKIKYYKNIIIKKNQKRVDDNYIVKSFYTTNNEQKHKDYSSHIKKCLRQILQHYNNKSINSKYLFLDVMNNKDSKIKCYKNIFSKKTQKRVGDNYIVKSFYTTNNEQKHKDYSLHTKKILKTNVAIVSKMSKTNVTALYNKSINRKYSFLGVINHKDSNLGVINHKDSKIGYNNDIIGKEYRTPISNNYITKGIYTTDKGQEFKLTVMNSPDTTEMLKEKITNSSNSINGGEYHIFGELNHNVKSYVATTKLGFTSINNKVKHDEDNDFAWQTYGDTNYGSRISSMQDGYDEWDINEQTITLKQDYLASSFNKKDNQHTVSFGWGVDITNVKFNRDKDTSLYNISENTFIPTNHIRKRRSTEFTGRARATSPSPVSRIKLTKRIQWAATSYKSHLNESIESLKANLKNTPRSKKGQRQSLNKQLKTYRDDRKRVSSMIKKWKIQRRIKLTKIIQLATSYKSRLNESIESLKNTPRSKKGQRQSLNKQLKTYRDDRKRVSSMIRKWKIQRRRPIDNMRTPPPVSTGRAGLRSSTGSTNNIISRSTEFISKSIPKILPVSISGDELKSPSVSISEIKVNKDDVKSSGSWNGDCLLPNDPACIEGEQFLTNKTVYKAKKISVNDNILSAYIQDKIIIGKFETTAGLRFDRTTLLNNNNIAPRLSSVYTYNNTTHIFGGINRYYSSSILSYILNDNISANTGYARINSGVWQKDSLDGYSFANSKNLKTPYSDELNLGLTKSFGNMIFTLKGVYRNGKDQFVKSKVVNSIYELNNNGKSKDHTLSFQANGLKPITVSKGILMSWNVETSYSKSIRNFNPLWNKITPEIFTQKVIFDGELINYNDIPTLNYNSPIRGSANLNFYIPKYNLMFGNTIQYRAGYNGYTSNSFACDSTEPVCGDFSGLTKEYTKTTFDSSLNLDLHLVYRPKKMKGLAITIDVMNVFNKTQVDNLSAINNFSVESNYSQGRIIWAGIKYHW